MDIIEFKKLIDEGYSQRQLGEYFNKSQGSIKYWLEKYGLKTDPHRFRRIEVDGSKECPKCKVSKPLSDFHVRHDRKGQSPSHFCKRCNTKNVLERQVKFKLDCLAYKGNTGCIRCGYNKSYVALEFHHTNPEEKDFSISTFKLYKFNDIVAKELDKCDVLCSNCHSEVHHEISKLRQLTI